MLLIEKVVKLLDDFHYAIFYEHVRTLSKRSYYPTVLLEVIDRDGLEEKPTERLFFEVYGEKPVDQKDLQKLFQLGHYTFRLTGFLSRNYPDYLYTNIARIQQGINSGRLDEAKQLADLVLDVAEKIEDLTTLHTVLGILAQHAVHQQAFGEGQKLYERMLQTLELKQQADRLNLLIYSQAFDKSAKLTETELDEKLSNLLPYFKSGSTAVRLHARLEYRHLLHVSRNERFFEEETRTELDQILEELNRNEHVVWPYLQNMRSKLDFLRLRYSMQQQREESVLSAAEQLIEDAAGELFWNSYINLPELSSIGVQTSFLVSNYFYSYREDLAAVLEPEIRAKIELLKNRSEVVLENPMLREQFIIPYINMTTIYAGLLLLGDEADLKRCVETLEYMLLHYQQVAFHAYLDPVFVTLIMANFALEDYTGLEKSYRRYKKSTKGKNVNFENDLEIHAYYYIAKYRETQRKGYAAKLDRLLIQAREQASLTSVLSTLQEVCEYFSVPVELD